MLGWLAFGEASAKELAELFVMSLPALFRHIKLVPRSRAHAALQANISSRPWTGALNTSKLRSPDEIGCLPIC
jgi:hypothetical protein